MGWRWSRRGGGTVGCEDVHELDPGWAGRGCLGAKLPRGGVGGVRLGRTTCKDIFLVRPWGRRQGLLQTGRLAGGGFGSLWKGWQRGRGGGAQRGKLWWPRHPAGGSRGLGARGCLGSESGAWHREADRAGGQDVGASSQRGCWSQEGGRRRASFGKTLQPGLRMWVWGSWIRLGVDREASGRI